MPNSREATSPGFGLLSSDFTCKQSGSFTCSPQVNKKRYSISFVDCSESTYLKSKSDPSEQGVSSVRLTLSLVWNLP